jgi:hypothetical protein
MGYAKPADRRAYHNAWHRERYATDPAYRKDFKRRKADRDKRRDQIVAKMLAAFRADGCINCAEKAACCLVAHHLDPDEKDFAVGTAKGKYGRLRVLQELAKCACLCGNCHTKLHAGVIVIKLSVLRLASKRAFRRVAAVEQEATEHVASEVRKHHEGRKRRRNLALSMRPSRRGALNGFKVPLAFIGKHLDH